MEFLFFIICALIFYFLNVFYLFNGVIPLFWIPYVLINIFKGIYKPSAILSCILPVLFWNLLLLIIGFILGIFHFSEVVFKVLYSPGAIFGGIIALIQVLINSLSISARQEFISRLPLDYNQEK